MRGFPKIGVPYLRVLVIRILLFWGTTSGSPIFGNSHEALKRALRSPMVPWPSSVGLASTLAGLDSSGLGFRVYLEAHALPLF